MTRPSFSVADVDGPLRKRLRLELPCRLASEDEEGGWEPLLLTRRSHVHVRDGFVRKTAVPPHDFELLREYALLTTLLRDVAGVVAAHGFARGGDGLLSFRMPFAGGALVDTLLPEEEQEGVFAQACVAVAHIHAVGVAHCDIKPDNVVVDAAMRVRLIDFGLAAVFTEETRTRSQRGSLKYAAPEVLAKEAHHPRPTDLWSLGMLAYVLWLQCDPPWVADATADERYRSFVASSAESSSSASSALWSVCGAFLPGVAMPRWVAMMVDRLLVVDPEGRRLPAAGE
jgi:serine/threonine protein kinase